MSEKRMEFKKEHKDNKKWCNGTMVQWHKGIILRESTCKVGNGYLFCYFYMKNQYVFRENSASVP